MTIHVFLVWSTCPLWRNSLSEGVWLCHHWPPGGMDLNPVQAHFISSARLSNLTGNAMATHAAVTHLGHASCSALKICQEPPTVEQSFTIPPSSAVHILKLYHLMSCTFRTSLPAHFRMKTELCYSPSLILC